jgi:hypothetical protein
MQSLARIDLFILTSMVTSRGWVREARGRRRNRSAANKMIPWAFTVLFPMIIPPFWVV